VKEQQHQPVAHSAQQQSLVPDISQWQAAITYCQIFHRLSPPLDANQFILLGDKTHWFNCAQGFCAVVPSLESYPQSVDHKSNYLSTAQPRHTIRTPFTHSFTD